MKKLLVIILLLVSLSSLTAYASNLRTNPDDNKASEAILRFLKESVGSTIEAYVIMEDVSSDLVFSAFRERAPEAFKEYERAQSIDTSSLIVSDLLRGTSLVETDINDDLLQSGIEIKRDVYREYYLKNNTDILEKHISSQNIKFMSAYAPLAIIQADVSIIKSLLSDERVLRIEEFKECVAESELVTACQTTTVNYLRDTCGNQGSGVKIGLLEAYDGVPNQFNSDLLSADITFLSSSSVVQNHATWVAQILVGSTSGIAPNASLVCHGFDTSLDYFQAVENLLTDGVNIINLSAGLEDEGVYDVLTQWTDHIAVMHDVHFVKSAGNESTSNTCGNITSPGMGYNVITVGGYNTNGSVTDSDDYLYFRSSFQESSNIFPRAEKPNLVAPAEDIILPRWDGLYEGTSLAAPMVTGVIADLCSYVPLLKARQTAMGAILAASCVYKVEGAQGAGVRGDVFASTVRITDQISNKEGAGKLNAKAARHIITMGQFWSGTKNSTDFPFEQTVYIDASSNTLMRTAIFWLRRNSLANNPNDYLATPVIDPFTNLDLYIYDPNGDLIAYSESLYANFEIAQYVPTVTGYYTIRVKKTAERLI